MLSGAVPLPDIAEFPGVLEAYREKYPDDLSVRRAIGGAGADLSDALVRTVFQVVPGVGGFVTPGSPAAVRVPVGIRWGGAAAAPVRTSYTTTSPGRSPPTRRSATASAGRRPSSSRGTCADRAEPC